MLGSADLVWVGRGFRSVWSSARRLLASGPVWLLGWEAHAGGTSGLVCLSVVFEVLPLPAISIVLSVERAMYGNPGLSPFI